MVALFHCWPKVSHQHGISQCRPNIAVVNAISQCWRNDSTKHVICQCCGNVVNRDEFWLMRPYYKWTLICRYNIMLSNILMLLAQCCKPSCHFGNIGLVVTRCSLGINRRFRNENEHSRKYRMDIDFHQAKVVTMGCTRARTSQGICVGLHRFKCDHLVTLCRRDMSTTAVALLHLARYMLTAFDLTISSFCLVINIVVYELCLSLGPTGGFWIQKSFSYTLAKLVKRIGTLG